MNSLYKLLYYCQIMFDYLLEIGKIIPDEISETLSNLNLKAAEAKKKYIAETASSADTRKINAAFDKSELHFAINEALKDNDLDLTKVYNNLVTLAAPATPKSIENTIPNEKMFYWWGRKVIPFMRNLWIMSIIFLAGYMITGYLNTISPNNIISSQLFLLFSAGLGAYFYSLNTAKKYVIERTFDNKYITHYYNRIIIGILAGLILANIIDVSFLQSSMTRNGGALITKLTPSLIAFLGGYSAQAVVTILNRIVAMLIALVQGEVKDIIEAKEAEIKNRFQAEQLKHNIQYASELITLMDSSSIKNDPETFKKLKTVIGDIVGTNGNGKLERV